MRLSPLLVAILTASVTVSLSTSASGQITDGSSPSQKQESKNEVNHQKLEASNNVVASKTQDVVIPSTEQLAVSQPVNSLNSTPIRTNDIVVPTINVKHPLSSTKISQNPTSSPAPTNAPVPENPNITPEPSATPTPETPTGATPAPEPRVLVSEVVVSGTTGELQDIVYQAINTQPGRPATRSQLQEDVNAIYNTGYFSRVNVNPEDTPLGVRVTFIVEPNPVLKEVRVSTVPVEKTKQVLPPEVVSSIFSEQYGQTLNLRRLQEGVKKLNQWYKDKGYDLAQVVDVPQVAPDGTVTLVVAEGVVEDIRVRFLNKDKQATNDQGEPIRGRTRNFIITRELQLKPGDVFNRQTAQKDLRRVYGLGTFEDVQLSFSPGQDPRQVVVVVDVIEKNTGSIAAGAGISSASGLFGTVSYQEQNLGGNNQKLGTEIQVGQRELLFDVNFTDPWIAGDPFRTAYTVNAFRRRTISLVFDSGDREVNLPGGDRPRVLRLGSGVTFTRPLSRNPLEKSEWVASLGLQYQRVSIRNADGDLSPRDERGNLLSFSESGTDDLTTLQLAAVRDLRNDPLRPTQGSLLRFGVEQTLPIGSGGILFNRLRGSYSYFVPVNYLKFNKGPQALAFNVQAGTVFGDLPPYEAFILGGSNSVRGYRDGAVGSGRSFVQATAEYRFPIFAIVGGALFVDAATDFGTGSSVPGDPAGVRGKPGNGLGYGLGVRVQSPLGPIRVDYGFNNEGDSRLHFGIGERF